MTQRLERIHRGHYLRPRGSIFLLYPKLKNAAGLAGIHRDDIFPHLGVDETMGFVRGLPYKFYKMISAGDVYTLIGLRQEEQGGQKPSRPSARVGDYEAFVPELEAALPAESRKLYQALALGYRRD